MSIIGLIGCNLWEHNDQIPSSPIQGQADQRANYAQMAGGSTTVNLNGEDHQINFVISEWGAYPYGIWIYAEINEQIGIGKTPGTNQIPVNIYDVTFTFSGLPGEVREILAGIKEKETTEDRYHEIGRYAVLNGMVTIPISYWDLVNYFGITHYSVWFQVIGGKNGNGLKTGMHIEMNGTLVDGQHVMLNKEIALGTNPTPEPTAIPSPACGPGLQPIIPIACGAASGTFLPGIDGNPATTIDNTCAVGIGFPPVFTTYVGCMP